MPARAVFERLGLQANRSFIPIGLQLLLEIMFHSVELCQLASAIISKRAIEHRRLIGVVIG